MHTKGFVPDKRSLRALEKQWLVKDGAATTAGWHAIGEMRFAPRVDVPPEINVDSWKNQTILIHEGTEDDYFDDDGILLPSVIDEEYYYLDLYKMMQWYRDIKIQEAQWITSSWGHYEDREYGHYKNTRNYNHTPLIARSEIMNNDPDFYYTGEIIYNICADLYQYNELRAYSEMTTTYKYSMQDNEGEFEQFIIKKESTGTWHEFYCLIRID